jgi:catechol 2,3-dioxygenase-like lactoylglutathione lyase family enzyme
MRATAILETVIYADDPEACAAFYRGVLGLEQVRAVPGRFNFLRCGAQMLLIFAPGPSSDPAQQNGIPAHGGRGQGHLCFRAADAEEFDAWHDHLRAAGVAI